MNADFVPPWEKADAFPEKPPDKNYGYILRGQFVGCTHEELIKKCGDRYELSHIHLVWCPQHPRVTPAANVEFLSEAILQRKRKQFSASIGFGLINMFVWVFLGLLLGGRGRTWMLFLATSTGGIPVAVGIYGLQKMKRGVAAQVAEEMLVGSYNAWVMSRSIIFTWLLLGAISVIFGLQCIFGFPESASAAGLDKVAVWHGQWWRLFTGPLLHGNVMHFVFNASALVGLGRMMEVLTSRYYLALVFGISAFSGSIFSLFLLPDMPSVGASGGLLGLIGFLAILGIKRKQVLPPGFGKSIAINVAIIAAMGILAFSIIDNAAHLGGFLAGVALGLCLIGSHGPPLPLLGGIKIKVAGVLALTLTFIFAGFAMTRIAH